MYLIGAKQLVGKAPKHDWSKFHDRILSFGSVSVSLAARFSGGLESRGTKETRLWILSRAGLNDRRGFQGLF